MFWRSKLKFSFFLLLFFSNIIYANPDWVGEWPHTNFNKKNIAFDEIISGGPPKDGIPAIDNPGFELIENIENIGDNEPVISVTHKNQTKAYPIRMLMFHEIVNDEIAELPISVTYCPLCNSSLVFKRKLENKILDFGTTGKLRFSNLIMYDRQTESWWEQFTGRAIIGEYVGEKLLTLPAQIESFSQFKIKHPKAKVLIPSKANLRPYGENPYVKYEQSNWPFLFRGNYQSEIPPLARVVAVENNAWPLSLVRKFKEIKYKNFLITWKEGQNSALDTKQISKGRDVGTVYVFQIDKQGNQIPISYQIPFAFTFNAFYPNGKIHGPTN